MQNTRELPRKERRICPSGSFSGIPAVLPCAARYGKNTVFSVCHGCFTIQGAVYSGQDSLQKNMRPGNKVKDAQTELSKFNFYLSEGEKLWSRSRPLVESRKFFELWESLHHPEPFLLEDTPFSLAGYRFELPEKRNWSVNFSGANLTVVRRLRLPAVTVVCFPCSASSTDVLR